MHGECHSAFPRSEHAADTAPDDDLVTGEEW